MNKLENKWYLYNQVYDLTNFMDNHPGGKTILELTKNEDDITATFESYHSLANINNIRKILDKYKISDDGKKQIYTFKNDEFYDICKKRVRQYFTKNIEYDTSVTHKIKATPIWYFKSIMIGLLYFYCFVNAFIIENKYDTIYTCLAAFFMVSNGFCTLHDASHFALFHQNTYLNELVGRIYNALVCWNHYLWTYRHSYRHHTYTGTLHLDLDQPLFEMNFINKIPTCLICPIIFAVTFIFPGSWFYFVLFSWSEYWYNKIMAISKEYYIVKDFDYIYQKTGDLEKGIVTCMFLCLFYKFNIMNIAIYIILSNSFYSLSVEINHETYETLSNECDKATDWGEIQVRNSANFQINKYYNIYHHLFGGINYQIEHHLFPSMCHIHYPHIAPIIQKTCKEFNIPYQNHSTIISGMSDFYKSFVTNIRNQSQSSLKKKEL
tara:strand:- start:566 stop:1873 length:1308 start_codon:yes stop_codon:yes gene_type:complete